MHRNGYRCRTPRPPVAESLEATRLPCPWPHDRWFWASHDAVTTAFPGMGKTGRVEENCAAGEGRRLSRGLLAALKLHAWPRDSYEAHESTRSAVGEPRGRRPRCAHERMRDVRH